MPPPSHSTLSTDSCIDENSKIALYTKSIITNKYENFYTPPDPNGIGGFFALKSTSKKIFKKYPDKSSSQFKQVQGLISS